IHQAAGRSPGYRRPDGFSRFGQRQIDIRADAPDRQRYAGGLVTSGERNRTMTQKLRDQLIGAWKLVSYEEKPVDGSPTVHPLGEDASGIIMYTPDGWMSAQLMRGGREHFASEDWFKGTLDEYRAEASTYIAYSGPFHVDEEKKTLTHSMFVSLFPDW